MENNKIIGKVLKIQQELKAPKGNYNSFGKYKYRSAEDILEAVKPIAHKYGAIILLTDEVVAINERYYVKATASLVFEEGTMATKLVAATAYAREEEVKKGMDGSQITGTASSYARKYALNGLLAIDDTKDADTDEYQKTTKKPQEKAKNYRNELVNYCNDNNIDKAEIARTYKINTKSKNEDFKTVLDILQEGK